MPPLDFSKLPREGDKLKVRRRYADETKKPQNVTYVVRNIIGQGGFGAVYKGECEEDRTVVAIKAEAYGCKHKMLQKEFTVMRIGRSSGSPYFTEYGERSRIPNKCFFFTMQLVGRNLWDLFLEKNGSGFSLHTACRVAIQTLGGIRDLHEVNYLHGDIKPGNFAVGLKEDDKDSIIYIFDFGMCRIYRNPRGLLREREKNLPYRGTNRYASCAALECKDQCRKDDLESWFYMVMEFIHGNVPWNKCKPKGAEARSETLKSKMDFRKPDVFDAFLEGCGVKHDLRRIMDYIDGMDWFTKPDYNGLRNVINKVIDQHSYRVNEAFEWSPKRIFQGPEWNRDTYVKSRDRYAKEPVKRDTLSDSSEGKKDHSVNDTVTGVTGGTTAATGEDKGKKDGDEKKEKRRGEEKKKTPSDKTSVHPEKLKELKQSAKREKETTKPAKVNKGSMMGPPPASRRKETRNVNKDTTGGTSVGGRTSGKRPFTK